MKSRSCRFLFFAVWLIIGLYGNILPANSADTLKSAVNVSFPPVDGEPLGHVPADGIVLHDGWQMRGEALAGNHGELFSKVDFAGMGWYSATVPATALGVLVRHGIYPDPYVRTNTMFIPDANDAFNQRYHLDKFSYLPDHANPWSQPYWFRTTFRVPQDYAGKTIRLHLNGINYRAVVWVNGVQVADATHTVGMFQRFSFDVIKLIQPGQTNALAVRIHPVDIPGDPVQEQLGGLNGGFGPNGGDTAILKNVTDYYSVGWDWIPAVRDRNMGIWQDGWLEATGLVTVRDPAAFTEVSLPKADQASVTVRGYLDNATTNSLPVELTTRIAPMGFADRVIEFTTTVQAGPGKSEFILKPADYPVLRMQHPHLWWPVGYGKASLYKLTVTPRVNGKLGGEAASLMGVRSVETSINQYGGREWRINGRTIRITGGAWVPDMLMSWSAQRYRDEVRLLAEGNHTLVRVNGCGITPPDCFFDACDRQGLMVWEDFSRTSCAGSMPRADLDLLLSNTKDSLERMRGHASIIIWCGSNERLPQEDFEKAMQDEVLPAMDGTRVFLVTSSANARYEKTRLGVWTGGPYDLQPLASYFHLYAKGGEFAFKDEIGLPSPPPINSIAPYLPDYDQPDQKNFPLNVTAGFHDATSGHFRPTDQFIHRNFGRTAGLADYLWDADLFNIMGYRAIYEAANKARPINEGTTLWKVNASWPSYMWQVFDWTLHCNGGYYSMKAACQPLHVQESEDDQGIQVVSTLARPLPGATVRITVSDYLGRVEHRESRLVDVAADATTPVGNVTAFINDDKLHFLILDLVDANGHVRDHQVKWVQIKEDWSELTKIGMARVNAVVKKTTEEGNETVYAIEVTNASSLPAVDVSLAILAGAQGKEVLPSFWSDNSLTMMPGEIRSLTVKYRGSLLQGEAPDLMVEGYNVAPLETSIADGRSATPELKLAGMKLDLENHRVTASATTIGAKGTRLTTWPVEVFVDGRFDQTLRVAVNGTTGQFQFNYENLISGEHTLALGNLLPVKITQPVVIWQLGNRSDSAFASPDFKKFAGDPNFILGKSNPGKDWPSAHPGPLDVWAGGKSHIYTLTFTMDELVDGGAGQLVIDVADVQKSWPPNLSIEINACKAERPVPTTGAGQITVPFPAGTLHAGTNQIRITTVTGSWLVYRDLKLCLPDN